jgi:myo-inositol-1(or 4)-monophosphatase
MTVALDLDFCAATLRAITDDIARAWTPADPASGLGTLIAGLHQLNAMATAKLRPALAERYPDIGWTATETGGAIAPSETETWIYDPIDGAYHFLQGLPLWSSSLALVKGDQTVAAFVYDPTLGEMFTASDEGPAMLNDGVIRVSQKQSLSTAVVGTAIPPLVAVKPDEFQLSLNSVATVAREAFVVRAMASASLQLAYVAAGRLDAYCELGSDTEDWLAGALLVRAAGGRVTDLAGRTFGARSQGVVAGPPQLLARLTERLGALHH